MVHQIFFLFLTSSLSSILQQATVAAQQKELLSYLFTDYHKELRPIVSNMSGPTNVTVQLYFKQLQKVKESDQILTVYCWLEEYWTDEYLTWEPENFGGLTSLHVPSDMIWKPDLLVYNNANMNVRENELHTNVLIEHTGKISLFRAIITDITCSLDMQRFPFDQQICFIMLASWSYDGSQIMLKTAESESGLNVSNHATLSHYIPNMEWRLIDFKYRTNMKYYECCPHPYPDISYFFSIKRNPSYYLFTLIVPSAFITIVTVIGFFTPHSSSGENTEKVSLGVTALLSLAIILMMVSDKLPATSKMVPLLGKYYIGLILIMFFATYCTTLTLSIQMKGNAGKPISKRIRQFLKCRLSRLIFVDLQEGKSERGASSYRLMVSKADSQLSQDSSDEKTRHSLSPLLIENNQNESNPAGQLITANGARKHLHTTSSENYTTTQYRNPSLLMAMEKLRSGQEQHQQFPLQPIMDDIAESVELIREDISSRARMRHVRKEWQLLARGVERFMMVFFMAFTTVFAALMLYDDQDLPMITEEFMNSSSEW
uniref:Uncharacterized protein n=1 Tax=Plectus sambesii TaxID=2011161 RepID=A0A914VKH5_9BILA